MDLGESMKQESAIWMALIMIAVALVLIEFNAHVAQMRVLRIEKVLNLK